jgi:nucleoside 2-deoxyribosyltransferase
VVKPCITAELGFDTVDMREVSQAGVIDNIMRAQIRDAAFVLIDLTHDNSGAYWEAGYAEGLGKPVVYLCEKTKFEQAKTLTPITARPCFGPPTGTRSLSSSWWQRSAVR